MVSLSDDGVLFAKNSDRDPNEAQVLRWHPAADHAAGSEVRCTWTSIPQVARTRAVLLSQPWWMWGAEMGTNDAGVVIGNQAVFTRGRVAPDGLLGMDLLRLALERAGSTHEAVGVLTALLEQHGQGGSCSHEHPGFRYHNSFLVADAAGAVVVETAGREWATEAVTGPGRSISNGLTIPAFARAHADPVRGRVAQCEQRRRRTSAAVEVARAPAHLFAALRDHGAGPSPRWSRLNGALAAPCAHAGGRLTSTQSTASWVSDLRASPLHWATATSAPCTSLFKPVRIEDPVDLDPGVEASNRYDPALRWWRHEILHRLVLRDHAASTARFVHARDRVENAWLHDPPATHDAFRHGDDLELAWAADLHDAGLPDRRPRWLTRLWTRLDEGAGMAPRGPR